MENYVLQCNCGCNDGFVFAADGELYVSSFSGDFGTMQETVRDRLARRLRLAFTGRKWLKEVLVAPAELEGLRDFLAGCDLDDNGAAVENASHLRLEYDADIDLYTLALVCDLDPVSVLRGKEYRCCELVLDKAQVGRLVKKLDRALAKAGRKAR